MAEVVLAHGITVRQDLPLPLSYVMVGAVSALVISFAGLSLLWRRSRLHGDGRGLPVPAAVQRVLDSGSFRWALRAVGLLLAGFTAVAAIFGPDVSSNPTAGLVYVIFWVGLVPLSLLLGAVWRSLNPLRTIHYALCRVLRLDPGIGLLPLPSWIGYWPAAIGLCSFVWLELASPDPNSLPGIRAFFVVYGSVNIAAGICFGSRWFDKGDAFEVYSSLIGRLSPLGRRGDGRLVLRNPLDGLDALDIAPGLVATICVLLGSTAFDGFSSSIYWIHHIQNSNLSATTWSSLGLLAAILLVGACYTGAATLGGIVGDTGLRALPGAFAHAIVPIVVGYLVAHYFSLFVFGGQQTFSLASDPLVNGANLFDTRGKAIDYSVVSASQIALVQLVAVVAGHIVGVVAAHDRAVRVFRRPRAIVGQVPTLVLMAGYTVGGLALLLGP